MFAKTSLDEMDPIEIDDEGGLQLFSVGYELRPEEMRPAVWEYEAGESNRWHRHGEQEELYVVLEGSFDVTVDEEEVRIEEGDYLVVGPESWRQLTAREDGRVLVVGAPNVKDDGIHEGDEE